MSVMAEEAGYQHDIPTDTIICSLCNISLLSSATKEKSHWTKTYNRHAKSKPHKKLAKKSSPKDVKDTLSDDDEENDKDGAAMENVRVKDDEAECLSLKSRAKCALCFLTGVNHDAYAAQNNLCIAPQYLESPRIQDKPFLTTQNGALPSYAQGLDEFLSLYASGRPARMPNIDVNHETQDIKSMSAARKTLQSAALANEPYWGAFVADDAITHPPWWPHSADREVPGYTQIIVSSGPTDIGLHVDEFSSGCKKTPKRLVDTYITMSDGVKQVIMLPPHTAAEVFPKHAKTMGNFPYPLEPDSALARRIVDAGGYYFELRAQGSGAATTLFVPKGWHHWLLGRCAWAVIFGGSLF